MILARILQKLQSTEIYSSQEPMTVHKRIKPFSKCREKRQTNRVSLPLMDISLFSDR